jgi:GNAT superfamily N-acetyltransferase
VRNLKIGKIRKTKNLLSEGGLHEPDESPDNVWSLVCFFISRKFRGQGVMSQLIQAAVEHYVNEVQPSLKPILSTPIPQVIGSWDMFHNLESSDLSKSASREVDVMSCV